ncbi:MAG: PAS domain S-box protein [Bacteroidota bacterium]|nr:PAS domain S-box protein [Bacteroidota bacterium]
MISTERSLSRIRLIYVLTTLFLVALSVYTFIQLKNLTDTSDWINRTNKINLSLQKISYATSSAETNLRGFLLTGDSTLLQKRDQALKAISKELNLMDSFNITNPTQIENTKALRLAIKEKILSMANVMKEYIPLQLNPLLKSTILDGVQKADDITLRINLLSKTETFLLENRIQKFSRLTILTPIFIIILFLSALLILLVSYFRINKVLLHSKELQNNLEQEKNLADSILQASEDLICVYDLDTRIIYYGKTCEKLFGKRSDEVIGKKLLDVFPQMKDSKAHHDLLKAIDGKTIQNAGYYSPVWQRYFENYLIPLKTPENKIYAVLTIAHDNTEKVLASEKLKQTNLALEEAQRVAQVGSWEWNVVQNSLSWSATMYHIYGIPEDEEITFANYEARLHPVDKEFVLNTIQAAFKNKEINEFDHRIVTPAGIEKHVCARGKVVLNEFGEVIKLFGTVQDITESKIAESKLQERTQFVETLINSSPDVIMVVDNDLRFLTINDKAQHVISAFYKEPVIGKKMTEVYPNAIKTPAYQNMVRALQEETVITLKAKSILSELYYEHNFIPLRNSDNQVYAVMVISHDISPQIQNELKIQGLNETFNYAEQISHFGSYSYHFKTQKISYSDNLYRLLGCEPQEFSASPEEFNRYVHPDDLPYVINATTEAFTHKGFSKWEYRIVQKNGHQIYVRGTGKVVIDSQNEEWMIGTLQDISDQKANDAVLKESEERMQTILQHAPDAVITIDEHGNILSLNPQAETIFGWKENEVLGKTLAETIVPERYREQHTRGIQHFLKTGEGPVINKPIEIFSLRKDNSEFPIELKISSTKINDRYIFIGFIRDISIRKQAEETIKNKTTQLMEAQQLAHIGSWEWDVSANKIEWSDELYRIYQLTPQEFEATYDNFIKNIHEDDRDYVNGIVQQAFEDHQPVSFFHKITGADGVERVISSTLKVFTDDSGRTIRMAGTAQDVTEQKIYESELKKGEERFFKIFDNNPIAMTLAEIKTNKIKFANNLFYTAFGYTSDEVIGYTSEEIHLISPEENAKLVSLIMGYLQEERSVAELQALSVEETEELLIKLKQTEAMKNFEVLYTRKNGDTFPAIVSYETVRIGNERFTITSYQDITERKKAEDLLKNQNEKLEKLNKELQSFAYISSHDLQEPLRKIQTFASRLLDKEYTNLSDVGKEQFKRMQEAGKRMQTLIDDLLAYSRTNTEERKFEYTPLIKIIDEVKEDFKEELQQSQAIVDTGELCEVHIIPFQFRQLIQNLFSNSIKFSNPERPIHIIIKCDKRKGKLLNNKLLSPEKVYCHITLCDNGIGFDPKYNEKVFEVFQRLHSKEKFKGTGIGLAIVKKIVENHFGFITARGIIDGGVCFDIYIPSA